MHKQSGLWHKEGILTALGLHTRNIDATYPYSMEGEATLTHSALRMHANLTNKHNHSKEMRRWVTPNNICQWKI